jgi:hypothetical protein
VIKLLIQRLHIVVVPIVIASVVEHVGIQNRVV